MRIRFGYDVHALAEGRELWLGGIRIEHSTGLLGHSDADVLIHAVCDALLGAASTAVAIAAQLGCPCELYGDIDALILKS